MKKQKIKLAHICCPTLAVQTVKCDDSSRNDSSSDDSDKDSFISDDGSDLANVFTKSIYEGSNLSVGASCILITQFSCKYKVPRKAQNDLLTLLKLHCPEGVEIALPQT